MSIHRQTARADTAASFTPSLTRRSAAIPNTRGTRALYTVNTQIPGNHSNITETRVLDLSAGTSTLFSSDAHDKEATWLGKGNMVLCLKEVDFGATEFWIADAADANHSHCAGRIAGKASHLKVKRLYNEYDDIAIAVACPATATGTLYNPEAGLSAQEDEEVCSAIWYTTLRKKAVDNSSSEKQYIISPTKFINALRGTGLHSPLDPPIGSPDDFDISTSGIVFLAKDQTRGSINFPSINVYYTPLKTFTEISRPRPQIINVKDHEGRSSCPVFSPNGSSVAFLKRKHPIDRNDRNRVIVINNIRDFRALMSVDDRPTQQSERDWHLSPYSVAWNDNGKELYVVAVEADIRKLFKIPAVLSSIRKDPEPITSESTTSADVRHLRTVFSAPMNAVP